MPSLAQLEREISAAMRSDQPRLRRLLRSIRQAEQAGKPFDRNLDRLARDAARSVELRQRRLAGVPPAALDPELPITARREEIAAAIRDHQVVVVCGETGSGKSTQLPKICLQLGRGVDGLIGHTQPRRIAARTIAARLAAELGSTVGQRVGFKIRFADETSPETYVKLMTDGVLLAETQGDRHLERYDTIIIDEAHERSLNIDFLLGYVKRLLPRRPDLRVIITSATIDAQRFAEHFGAPGSPAPVIEVSGRAYPVEVRYRPLQVDEEGGEPDLAREVADAVEDLARDAGGDVLVFLPTEREIRNAAKTLRGRTSSGALGGKTEVLPLYARLSTAEQNKIFQPHKRRRIVLATNVAESSLTVPGIRSVIDTGTARVSRYSPRSKVQRLPIEPVAQASADQRMGRCGRVGPGICVRLFSEDDYLSRDRYATPEIRRTNLAAVILQLLALKLGEVEDFPFLDPPRSDNVRDGYKTLFELGAIDTDRRLTDLGRQLARLPVDPRIGRMILAGHAEGCLHEVLIIASALEVQDPRERPADKQEAADAAHARFLDENSDFLGYLKLWDFFHHLKDSLSRNQLRKACQQNFLSFNRLREWQDVHLQLLRLVGQTGMKPGPRRDQYDPIHRALLTGLLSNLATLSDRHEYQGAAGKGFYLWPGSGLFSKKPKWIVCAELVETTRRFLRTAARIDPAWIEPLAGHLVNRTYSDPYWSRKRGTVLAHEKVTIFGLTVSAGRRVPFGPINADTSRELFITFGLVEGQLNTRAAFFEHNRRLCDEIESLGAKARNRDYFVGPSVIHDFYDARLPADVHDNASLNKWLQESRRGDPRVLMMTRADLLPEDAGEVPATDFPDDVQVDSLKLRVDYRFEPGNEDDGVTLVAPREGLGQLHEDRLGWLVPGLLVEKVTALIRTLPKPLRRSLVPAPDTAREAVARMAYGEGAFLPVVADTLSRIAGQRIPPDAFDLDKLPEHLKMNIRVVDEQAQPIIQGRDIAEIRRELGEEATPGAEIADEAWRREGLTRWDFGLLPERVETRRGAFVVPGFPALVDDGAAVSLRLYDNAEFAARQSHAGVRRLFCLSQRRLLKQQADWLPDLDRLELCGAALGVTELPSQLQSLIAERALFRGAPTPRSEAEFESFCAAGREHLGVAVQEVTRVVAPLLTLGSQVPVQLERAPSQARYAVEDMREQFAGLTPKGFLTQTLWEWLEHFPRYFEAMLLRLDKLRSGGGPRDRRSMDELQPHQAAYRERRAEHESRGVFDAELEHFRWMLEEFRVSLFAQELGTSLKVSGPRLDKQWLNVRP